MNSVSVTQTPRLVAINLWNSNNQDSVFMMLIVLINNINNDIFFLKSTMNLVIATQPHIK
jgi:hypothetical protein